MYGLREGKGREGKGREGKGREGKGREGKGREGKGREGKGSMPFKRNSVPRRRDIKDQKETSPPRPMRKICHRERFPRPTFRALA